MVTSDRLELCLRKHLDAVAARGSWVAPVSLFVTFVAALCASTFHDFFNISAATWTAAFILLAAASLVCAIIAIIKARSVRTSLETLINEIKKVSDVRIEE